jgi:hypothetical protein
VLVTCRRLPTCPPERAWQCSCSSRRWRTVPCAFAAWGRATRRVSLDKCTARSVRPRHDSRQQPRSKADNFRAPGSMAARCGDRGAVRPRENMGFGDQGACSCLEGAYEAKGESSSHGRAAMQHASAQRHPEPPCGKGRVEHRGNFCLLAQGSGRKPGGRSSAQALAKRHHGIGPR